MEFNIRNATLLFLGCVLFHAAGSWSVPLIDRDEPRFAEASREMRERRDYIVPYFNNEYRFDKPPFTYWAQAASYKILGENDFAARFPSMVAAALTAVSLFAWGWRIGNARAGWWAAVIFSLCLQMVIHGKAAVADMWLVLFVTIAHWAGAERFFNSDEERPTPNGQRPAPNNKKSESAPSSAWWWTFYLALAFAFLAKGPIGLTPLLTVAGMALVKRPAGLARRFKFFRGVLLTLAVVSLWGVPALIQTHGLFWEIGIGRHVVARSFTAMGGHGAHSLAVYVLLVPFYFVTVFVSFFPWSIKLPWLVKRLRQTRDSLDLYLLIGALIVFLIFSFVTTKLLHYTLPAFPLLALLLARHLAAENRFTFAKRLAIATAVVSLMLLLFVAPFMRAFFPGWQLFVQSQSDLKPEMQFGAVGYNEPSLVWYFRSRVRGWLQTSALHEGKVRWFMEQTGPRFFVLPTDMADRVYPDLPTGWKKYSVRGFNAVKGQKSDVTLILKPD